MAVVVTAVVATIAFAACAGEERGGGDGGTDVRSDVAVAIEDFAFKPERIEIASGTTVTWTNRDAILHTVTSGIGQEQGVPGVSENKAAKPSGLFDQDMDGKGATFSFTFEEPGEFDYFCSIHPGMTAVVVVE